MNTKNIQKILVIIIPILVLGFILFYSPKPISNKRTVAEREIATVDMENYEPKLANLEQYPTETTTDITALRTETKTEGTGEATVQNGDTVSVYYRGWLATDGSIFDSATEKGSYYPVTVGQGAVIEGWDLGLVGMKQGEVRRLFIPSELAYGETGQGAIPGNADLVFDVELVGFN